jgi:hypothetical protein
MGQVVNFFVEVFAYFALLFAAIGHALRLDPEVFRVVEEYPESGWVVLGIVLLAGASMLMGQSAVLVINGVRGGRFALSLLVNGILYVISFIVWGGIIALVGMVLFKVDVSLWTLVRVIGLSTAPLVFGFLIMAPYIGPFIGKVLNVWSFLILLTIVAFEFGVGFWGAVITVGLGWLISLALSNTIGRPIMRLRNKVWQKVTGSPMEATAQDILLKFSSEETIDALTTGGAR